MWSVPLVLSLALAFCISLGQGEHIQYAIRRGAVKVIGVNLGGWLVGEYWMTKSAPIWAGVPPAIAEQGEYAAMKYLGHAVADPRVEQWRSTFITEADIAEIASRGLNTVRVPIGYWIRGEDPNPAARGGPNAGQWQVFTPGALKFLDQLVNVWAVKYNVAVLLSLHAHQGSQSGEQHSAPPVYHVPQWSLAPQNVQNSVDWAVFMAERYRNSPAFLGLTLLNEPEFPVNQQVVKEYYTRVYTRLRELGNDCVLVLSPMLTEQGTQILSDFLRGAPHVWVEWHPYFKWGYEGMNAAQLIVAAREYRAKVAAWTGNPLLIAEWSLGRWAQHATFSFEQLREFAQTQIQTFQPAVAGWLFWTWKVINSDPEVQGWSLQTLLRQGILTVPRATRP